MSINAYNHKTTQEHPVYDRSSKGLRKETNKWVNKHECTYEYYCIDRFMQNKSPKERHFCVFMC